MRPIQAACDQREGSQSCSAFYIADRLGHRERSGGWVFGQIKQLIEQAGFPPPIIRLVDGQPVQRITAASRWQREPVDRWFDAQPSARLAIPLADAARLVEEERITRELDERSALIAAGRL